MFTNTQTKQKNPEKLPSQRAKTLQTMDRQTSSERTPAGNTGLAKVAVQWSADTFVVNQSLVLRINPAETRDGKIATFAKPETVICKR